MTLTFKPRIALALAAAALAGLFAAPTALAAPPSKTAHTKKMSAHTLYVCKDCKAFYSAGAAKKMGYKDSTWGIRWSRSAKRLLGTWTAVK